MGCRTQGRGSPMKLLVCLLSSALTSHCIWSSLAITRTLQLPSITGTRTSILQSLPHFTLFSDKSCCLIEDTQRHAVVCAPPSNDFWETHPRSQSSAMPLSILTMYLHAGHVEWSERGLRAPLRTQRQARRRELQPGVYHRP